MGINGIIVPSVGNKSSVIVMECVWPTIWNDSTTFFVDFIIVDATIKPHNTQYNKINGSPQNLVTLMLSQS